MKMNAFNWVEIVLLFVLALGFLLSVLAPSAALSYATIFAAGMISGRVIYSRKKSMVFPYVIIVAGFLLGYLIGARYGDYRIIALLYIIGASFSYYIHEKGLISGHRNWP